MPEATRDRPRSSAPKTVRPRARWIAVLALLILFQEDIRVALATAGGTFFQRTRAQSASDAAVLEEVVKAVFALASRKIGALVVIERQVKADSAHGEAREHPDRSENRRGESSRPSHTGEATQIALVGQSRLWSVSNVGVSGRHRTLSILLS